MSVSPGMFNDVDPPGVHIILHTLERPEDEHRLVTVTIRPHKAATLWFSHKVDRYSPEWSIMRAISVALEALEGLQRPVTKADLETAMRAAIEEWVAPF